MQKRLHKNIALIITAIIIMTAPVFSSTGVLKLKISFNNYSDETAIRFMQGATTEFDACCDAWKLFSPNYAVPNIFTKTSSSENLSINSFPDLESPAIVNLFLRTGIASTYVFEATEIENFSSDIKIIMKDLITGSLYDLRSTTPFTISLPSITDNNTARFQISFSPPTSIPYEDTWTKKDKKPHNNKNKRSGNSVRNNNITVFPNPASNYCMIEISSDAGTEASVKITDMLGKTYYSHIFVLETDSTAILLDLKNKYPSGTYAIVINTKDEFYTKKIMIENN